MIFNYFLYSHTFPIILLQVDALLRVRLMLIVSLDKYALEQHLNILADVTNFPIGLPIPNNQQDVMIMLQWLMSD